MKFKIIIFLSLLLSDVLAQDVSPELISSAGTSFSINNNLHLDWSIGELAIITLDTEDVVITQGLHQSYPMTTSSDMLLFQNDLIRVFPNPTSNNINIEVHAEQASKLSVEIYSMTGQLLIKSFHDLMNSSNLIEVNLNAIPDGIYSVLLTSDSNIISQSFKIQKINH